MVETENLLLWGHITLLFAVHWTLHVLLLPFPSNIIVTVCFLLLFWTATSLLLALTLRETASLSPSSDIQPSPHLAKTVYCPLCKCIGTPETKHCRQCNACVSGFDHHCKWISNCVGEGNYAQFIGFCAAVALTMLFQGSVGIFLATESFRVPRNFAFWLRRLYSCESLKLYRGITLAVVVYELSISLCICTFLLFHGYLWWTNQTTYSWVKRRKATPTDRLWQRVLYFTCPSMQTQTQVPQQQLV